jgi:hypothetical protein
MDRVRSSGACFALQGGYPVDSTPFAYLCPANDASRPAWTGVLLALVEPVEPAPGASDAATAVIYELKRACDGVTSDEAIDALDRVIQEANTRLFHENASRAISHRIHLGFTALVLCGDDLYIAQVSPGRLFVRQDQTFFVFPQRTDGGISPQRAGANALGQSRSVQPNFYYTRSSEADLIIALSSDLARYFETNDTRLQKESSIVTTLELLLEATERHYVSTGHGVISFIPKRPSSASITFDHTNSSLRDPRNFLSTDDWSNSSSQRLVPETESPDSDTEPLDPVALTVQTGSAHERTNDRLRENWSDAYQDHNLLRSSPGRSATIDDNHDHPMSIDVDQHRRRGKHADCHQRIRQADDIRYDQIVWLPVVSSAPTTSGLRARRAEHEYPGGSAGLHEPLSHRKDVRGTRYVELLAGLVLSLTAAVVGAWQVTKRDRPIHGPLDDGSFGLPKLQRWDESYRPPRMQRVRSRLPRLEISRVVVLVAITLVLVLSGVYFLSRASTQSVQQTAEVMTLLQQAEAQRLAANALSDPMASYLALLDAEATLATAEAVDTVDVEQLAGIRSLIAADIASVTRSHRLSNVQIVGSVPAAPAGTRGGLVQGNGKLYLLADGVYHVDTFSTTLIRLLMPGDIVDASPVGTIKGATWREDRLIAIDSTRSYAFDVTRGIWAAEELSSFDAAGYDNIAAIATFDRNLYLVAPDSGQILKFQAGAYDGPPEDWSAGVTNADLYRAVDIAIDGHVLVLLDDGRVLDLFRSRLEAILTPQVIPPLEHAAAIAVPRGSPFIYVLHTSDGRIIRMTRDGEVIQQFTSPLSGAIPILADATDLVIDETANLAYVLARGTIYTVRLPSAPE